MWRARQLADAGRMTSPRRSDAPHCAWRGEFSRHSWAAGPARASHARAEAASGRAPSEAGPRPGREEGTTADDVAP